MRHKTVFSGSSRETTPPIEHTLTQIYRYRRRLWIDIRIDLDADMIMDIEIAIDIKQFITRKWHVQLRMLRSTTIFLPLPPKHTWKPTKVRPCQWQQEWDRYGELESMSSKTHWHLRDKICWRYRDTDYESQIEQYLRNPLIQTHWSSVSQPVLVPSENGRRLLPSQAPLG